MTLTLQPILDLDASRGLLCAHLLRLDGESRARRFGGGISEAGLQAYCARWSPAAAFALVDAQGAWRGVVEIVAVAAGQAELALSIEEGHRGYGWGSRLLASAGRWGRGHGVEDFVLTIATHNPAMQALAHKAGAQRWVHDAWGASTAHWSVAPQAA